MGRTFYWVFGIATALLLASPFLVPGMADWSYIGAHPLELLTLLVPVAVAAAIPSAAYLLLRNGRRDPLADQRSDELVRELRKVRRGRTEDPSPAEILKAARRKPPRPASYHARATPPPPLLPEPSWRAHAALIGIAFALSTAVGIAMTEGEFHWRLPAGVAVSTLALSLPMILLLRRPWRASPCSRGPKPAALVKAHPWERSAIDHSKDFPFLNRRWG